MKKILLSLLTGATLGLVSCDMNTTQYGVIDDTSVLSYEYVTNFRNYAVYSRLRGAMTGAWVYDADLQCDQFIGLSNNGSRGMVGWGDGFLNASNGDVTSFYNSCYTAIAQINYFLEAGQKAINSGELNEEQTIQVKRYLGEAHYARAYFYSWLYNHYCGNYDEATADQEGLGLCLVSEYRPNGNPSSYPGRSSQNATIQFIDYDLTAAFDALTEYENTTDESGNKRIGYTVAGSNYLSSYAVAALQSRFALWAGQYAVAADKAKYVIGNGNYKLAQLDDYIDMWYDENVAELIWAPYVDKNESASLSSICQGWNYYWATANQCDYIPTQETVLSLAEYEDADENINDIRFYAFVEYVPVNVAGGKTNGYAFCKYPGVPELSPSTNMYLNKPKPFRLSEQYLILAEASSLNSDMNTANSAMNTLIKARLVDNSGYTDQNLGGQALTALIRSERSKELIGEGFRTGDLRRWKIGFDRNQPYQLNPAIAEMRTPTALQVSYTATDYRYVWPIPSSEMDINPQLAGQQNPGY